MEEVSRAASAALLSCVDTGNESCHKHLALTKCVGMCVSRTIPQQRNQGNPAAERERDCCACKYGNKIILQDLHRGRELFCFALK